MGANESLISGGGGGKSLALINLNCFENSIDRFKMHGLLSMLANCSATVYDASPTSTQHLD